MEFLQMVGPHGFGGAEMAVSLAELPDEAAPSASPSASSANASATGTAAEDGGGTLGRGRSLLKRISGNTMSMLTTAMGSLKGPATADAHSHHLHAYLTFVSLPVQSIVTSLLDSPTKPIFLAPSNRTSTSSLASAVVSPTPAVQSTPPQ